MQGSDLYTAAVRRMAARKSGARGISPAKRDGPAVRGFPGVSRRGLAKGAPEGKKAT